jgi:hypothetical protein
MQERAIEPGGAGRRRPAAMTGRDTAASDRTGVMSGRA